MATLRGFARLDPDTVREMGRRGGAAVSAEKRSFSRDQALAQAAGRRGGQISRRTFPEKTDG